MRSDPDVFPYEAAKSFTYVEARTGRLFNVFAFIIRVMCIDPHQELMDAWEALNEAKARTGVYPPEALGVFHDVRHVDYTGANGRIREVTASSNKLQQVQLAKELSDIFRKNYRRAAELARQAK